MDLSKLSLTKFNQIVKSIERKYILVFSGKDRFSLFSQSDTTFGVDNFHQFPQSFEAHDSINSIIIFDEISMETTFFIKELVIENGSWRFMIDFALNTNNNRVNWFLHVHHQIICLSKFCTELHCYLVDLLVVVSVKKRRGFYCPLFNVVVDNVWKCSPQTLLHFLLVYGQTNKILDNCCSSLTFATRFEGTFSKWLKGSKNNISFGWVIEN